MPSYMIRGVIPEGLIAHAKARARAAGQSIDALIVAWLEAYAEHGTVHVGQARGGRAVADARTPEERQAASKHALAARWAKPRTPREPC